MDHYSAPEHLNNGTGEDLSIRELAELVRDIVHPAARLSFDTSKPDGTPRKQLNVSRLHQLGWHHKIDLAHGIRSAYEWYLQHKEEARGVPTPV
jgi:GDP-L-fucose synthase